MKITKEDIYIHEVYPLKPFDMNNEMINHEIYISVTFRGSVLVADTWDKIKEYSK